MHLYRSVALPRCATVGHGSQIPRPDAPHLPLPLRRAPFPPLAARNNLARYDSQGAIEVVQRLHDSGVYARVLGNVAYVMVSPTTPAEACDELMAAVTRVVRGPGEEGGGGTASIDADAIAYSV